ncbi:MAG: hypothetical protein Fur0015_08490 [Ignavibacteriales bacterium]
MNDTIFQKYSDVSKFEIKTHYSRFGWFLLTFIGMSAKPIKVEIIEKSSGKIVQTITKETILKKFIGR